jgi:outer membrane protein OmpA-like peptidoglycan-associated protein
MKRIVCLVGIAVLAASCSGRAKDDLGNAPPILLFGPLEATTAPDEFVFPQAVVPPARRQPRAAVAADKQNGARNVASARVVAPARSGPRWTSYKRFTFDGVRSDLQPADSGAVSEIAAYMARNPLLHVGIDGTDMRDPDLGRRRAAAVRAALVKAGVASSRVETGDFANSRLKRGGKIEVLLASK